MLRQCSTITCLLLLVSIGSKLASETSSLHDVTVVQNLMEKAIHWSNVASNGTELLNVYQHLVTALTFVYSAREIMSDFKLEKMTGIEINSFVRTLEKRISDTRQNIMNNESKTTETGTGRKVKPKF